MNLKGMISAAVLSVATAFGAQAATLSGAYYDVGGFLICCSGPTSPGTPVNSASDALAFVNSNAATATFQSTGISYNMTAPHLMPTLGGFLGSDVITLSGNAGDSFLGTILTFTGVINLLNGNNVFDIFSDDGFILYVDGVEKGRLEGLRAPGSTTLNVASSGGNKSFRLIYFEGSQTQAALQVKLNGATLAAVPLPAGGLLLLGGLGALALARRRKQA
jgi:hypothetical protein